MICKECGAYNSDHASYCKVCAAALKGDVSENDAADVVEDSRPTRRFVSPSWTAPAFKASKPAAAKSAESVEEEEEDLFIHSVPVNKPVRPIDKVKAKHVIPDELEAEDEPEEEPE